MTGVETHGEETVKPLHRLGVAATLAGTLAVTLVAATPAAASTNHRPLVVATITVGDICTGLADYIQFLEGRPASRLRDFLLTQAQRLSEKLC